MPGPIARPTLIITITQDPGHRLAPPAFQPRAQLDRTSLERESSLSLPHVYTETRVSFARRLPREEWE